MQRNSCLLLVIIFFTRTCAVIATVLSRAVLSRAAAFLKQQLNITHTVIELQTI